MSLITFFLQPVPSSSSSRTLQEQEDEEEDAMVTDTVRQVVDSVAIAPEDEEQSAGSIQPTKGEVRFFSLVF